MNISGKYSTCKECDIRHTCGKMGDKGSYISDMLKEIEKELNIK